MVWALKAVDPASAPSPAFYLKSASTYSVGRKDCYITIQTDKTISRLHANLLTEEAKAAAEPDHVKHVDDIPRMSLRVHDLSKFGTFVNKKPGSKALGGEAPLKEGDVVTFGTLKTSFRVEFVPFFLCISASNVRKENPTIKFALRHGAYAVEAWKEGCTHVLVDEGSAVTEMVIAAVASRKPVLQINWWQKFSLETEVVTEVPPYNSFLPTLVYQATPIKIALPELRNTILQDYSFFLAPLEMYEQGNYLVRLLEAAGATVEFLAKTTPSVLPGTKQQFLVKARDGTVKEAAKLRHLSRTSEDKLVLAVLAGQVDVSSLLLPPSPVASADSDETREESDGNEDQDTAGSLSFKAFVSTPPPSPPKSFAGASAHIPIDLDDESPGKRTSTKRSRQEETEVISSTIELPDNITFKRQKVELITETPGLVESQDIHKLIKTEPPPAERGRKRLTIDKFFSQQPTEGSKAKKKMVIGPDVAADTKGQLPKDEVVSTKHAKSEFFSTGRAKSEAEIAPVHVVAGALEADVVFSPLVVRDLGAVLLPATPAQGSGPNFKRFRQKGLGAGVSGNAFSSLVPFAKEPYRDSDLGRERNEFMQEERRRKEAEIIAEDLFHNEKLKSGNASKSRGRPRK